jgi:hypothetical protein
MLEKDVYGQSLKNAIRSLFVLFFFPFFYGWVAQRRSPPSACSRTYIMGGIQRVS